jgi:hypothetical protein
MYVVPDDELWPVFFLPFPNLFNGAESNAYNLSGE